MSFSLIFQFNVLELNGQVQEEEGVSAHVYHSFCLLWMYIFIYTVICLSVFLATISVTVQSFDLDLNERRFLIIVFVCAVQ